MLYDDFDAGHRVGHRVAHSAAECGAIFEPTIRSMRTLKAGIVRPGTFMPVA